MLLSRAAVALLASLVVSPPLSAEMFDQTTRRVAAGTLPNGYRYIILDNDRTDGEVFVDCYVDAGYADAVVDKSEVAHVLEHLALTFYTDEAGRRASYVEYMDKLGLRLGINFNASTYRHATSYNYSVPDALLPAVLRQCRYIAGDFLVTDKEFEAQLGVVKSEVFVQGEGDLFSRGLRQVTQHPSFPPSIAERLAAIAGMRPSDVRTFYRQSYRPDRQILFVEGNIDLGGVEEQIRSQFGDIRKPRTRAHRVGDYVQPPFLWIPAAGQKANVVHLRVGVDAAPRARDPRNNTALWAAQQLLKMRVQDVLDRNRGNIERSDVRPSSIIRDPDSMAITFTVMPERFELLLEQVVKELGTIHSLPLSDLDLIWLRAAIQRFMPGETSVRDLYVAGALAEKPGTPLSDKLEPAPSLAETITRGEIQDALQRLTAPESLHLIVRSEVPPANWNAQSMGARIASQYPAEKHLPSAGPPGGADSARLVEGDDGVIRIVMTNGLTLRLRSDRKVNGTNISVVSQRTDFGDPALLLVAHNLPRLIENSGILDLSAPDLEQLLLRRRIQRRITLDTSSGTSSISLSSDAADLGDMFQLLSLHIGAVPVTVGAGAASQQRALLEGRSLTGDPGIPASFWLATGKILPTQSLVEVDASPTYEQAASIWQHLYGDFTDLEVEVSGRFAPDEALLAARKHLGRLRSAASAPPEAVSNSAVGSRTFGLFAFPQAGRSATTLTSYFTSEAEGAGPAAEIADALSPLAMIRFQYRLREAEALAYSPAAGFSYDAKGKRTVLNVGATIEPALRDRTVTAICDALVHWQKSGLNERETAAIRTHGKGVTADNALRLLRSFSCTRSATFAVEPEAR